MVKGYKIPCHRVGKMSRRLILLFLAHIAGLVVISGCKNLPHARIVRVMLNTNAPTWRLKIDGTNFGSTISNQELTNTLAIFNLRQGDIILLGSLPQLGSDSVSETWKWLHQYSESNSVAVYLYGVYTSTTTAAELFHIPVYHWATSFANPRRLTTASFYKEGVFLGIGKQGFEKMLHDIAHTHPRNIFILGSQYDQNSSFGDSESPFDDQEAKLDRVLNSTGTERIRLSSEMGF
jgi:hypothetical protein